LPESRGLIEAPSNIGINAIMAAEAHKESPLHHVMDSPQLEFPWGKDGMLVDLPTIHLGLFDLQITRFMVMELVAALLIAGIIIPLARHIAKNPITRGRFLNAFEVLVLFIRDGVARPAIGGHDADRFLPYLWTAFFFVLFNNLMGIIPGGSSPTGNINVTAVLAVMTLLTVTTAGMRQMGIAGFWIGLVPHLEVPGWMKAPLWGLMFMIEIAGLLIRHVVLSVRLFANMFAGHVVLSVILGFILLTWNSPVLTLVLPSSITGVILLSLLELFVAFLQAYIFTFLSALFIGFAIHPH
jgi:F-type H+-transporting ATPase subunit a